VNRAQDVGRYDLDCGVEMEQRHHHRARRHEDRQRPAIAIERAFFFLDVFLGFFQRLVADDEIVLRRFPVVTLCTGSPVRRALAAILA
jgi:hypothetical protein